MMPSAQCHLKLQLIIFTDYSHPGGKGNGARQDEVESLRFC